MAHAFHAYKRNSPLRTVIEEGDANLPCQTPRGALHGARSYNWAGEGSDPSPRLQVIQLRITASPTTIVTMSATTAITVGKYFIESPMLHCPTGRAVKDKPSICTPPFRGGLPTLTRARGGRATQNMQRPAARRALASHAGSHRGCISPRAGLTGSCRVNSLRSTLACKARRVYRFGANIITPTSTHGHGTGRALGSAQTYAGQAPKAPTFIPGAWVNASITPVGLPPASGSGAFSGVS